MQLQTETTTTALDRKIEAAEGQHRKLIESAGDAEAEAQRWQTTFEREPTEQAHATAAVARQRAKNAQAAAEAFERDTLAPLVAERNKLELDTERTVLAAEIDIAHVHALQDRIERAVLACADE